jgi:glycerol uptake facilitator-like aquaporin/protein-tyrosine-phosphatase
MSERIYKVLFLCTGNTARSILAEAILRKDGWRNFRAFSAGSQPKGTVNPFAIKVLDRLDYPTDGLRSKSWEEFARSDAPVMDFVFTVCDNAAGESCPLWPGQPMTAHWGIEDPAAVEGADLEKEAAFVAAFRRDTAARYRPHRRLHLRQGQSELMGEFDLPRRLAAEALGTALLVATVVGSGIMAETLTKDVALALLGNTLPTGAILVVLITILGPISGAHFNPAVTLVFAVKGELGPRDALGYVSAQVAGGIAGTMVAHAMFALPLIDASLKVRTGGAQWFAEGVAAFGLLATILAGIRFNRSGVPWLVGLYITAAYWFTASTSFANPAVAIARSLTNTFSGIRPADLPGFIAAELAGAVVALIFMNWLLRGAGEAATAEARP